MDNVAKNLEYLFQKKAAWFGDTPPIIADGLWLNPKTNFRVEPEKHGTYEVVWVYEYQLFSGTSWPLLFDEAICLLGETGTLVVRLTDNDLGTVFEFKSYLFRRYDLDVKLKQQLKANDGHTLCVFDVRRLYLKERMSNKWTIGILTNGRKNDNVAALINKASSLISHDRLEFIVAGEFDLKLAKNPELIKLIELDATDNLPRISEKKYEIARNASHENIAVFHDRYAMGDDFFDGFDRFGYDFNFLTVRQEYDDGSFFPGYVGMGALGLKWRTPKFDKNPGTFHTGHFLNGGVMIFKKSLLSAINFNPLLLHNEAEDVELSFTLNQNGVIPRINVFSSMVTVGVPSNYTGTFVEVSEERNHLSVKQLNPILLTIWKKLPDKVKTQLRFGRVYLWVRNKVMN